MYNSRYETKSIIYMSLEWTYNPTNYYLIILRRDQIINHIEYNEVYDSVIGLLTHGGGKPGIELINSEMNSILDKGYSLSYKCQDNSIAVVFTSKYIHNNINSTGVGKIAKYILQIKRDRKLDEILK